MSSSEADKGKKTTPIEMYQANLKSIPSDISALLSSYSGIPADQQNAHITQVRNQAYKTHPYPCLGRWRFLELDLANHPLYHSHVLPALLAKDQKGEHEQAEAETWMFLDLGTCLGQDIRKLIFDGADVSRLYGADLKPEFIDMGYALFRDEDKFPRDHFIAPADVFDLSTETELSKECDGKVGILQVSAVFHLFDLEKQKIMAQRCLRLLDPRRKRVLLCGGQVGNVNASEFPRARGGGTRFRHNEESWRQMWEEAVGGGNGEWKGKIQGVEVGCVMEERLFPEQMATSVGGQDEGEQPNNTQRQIGSVEEGFRWMKCHERRVDEQGEA
ncbi:hypothetical protein LTR67_007642 [Exophiala xenobiotica]